jgi:hypothetical protein
VNMCENVLRIESLVIHLCFPEGRCNDTNIYIKFYLNRGPQESEIYIANIPRCEQHDKIKFNENKLPHAPPLNYMAYCRDSFTLLSFYMAKTIVVI